MQSERYFGHFGCPGKVEEALELCAQPSLAALAEEAEEAWSVREALARNPGDWTSVWFFNCKLFEDLGKHILLLSMKSVDPLFR